MITKEKILEIIEDQIVADGYFVVEVKVRTGNRISVYVDGNEGVTIEYIKKVSRLIESSFDREVEDFEMEVSSPGIGQPLKVLAQYVKSIGKTVKVTLMDGSVIDGILENATNEGFSVKSEKMEKRDGDKKKCLYAAVHSFTYKEVKSVIDVIIF